jgi:DNA-binding transcriptional ArsR family regulator
MTFRREIQQGEDMQSVQTLQPIDSTLAAIVAHPTRVRCFVILAERIASPNEIALALKKDVGHVSYHVKRLEKIGAVELVRTRPVRGAVEHFYRAVERPIADDDDWGKLTPAERASITRYILQLHVADATRAVDAGTFDARANRCLIRTPVMVDEEGFDELNALHVETYERTLEIQARSAERLTSAPNGAIPTMTTTMFFELPPPQ